MFKLTHPSSLPGRKRHTQLGIVWNGACHLASLCHSHTHMHTHCWVSQPSLLTTGAWVLCFHGNLYQQSSHGCSRTSTKCCEQPCVWVSLRMFLRVWAPWERYLVLWRAQMFRHSLGWFVSWPLSSLSALIAANTHRHTGRIEHF